MACFNYIKIDSFRGISKLAINNLKPINLIVGDNNCGKTSVLEAIQLLRTSGNLANVYKVSRQRDSISISGANSVFDDFICMFPADKKNDLTISISGLCDSKKVSFLLTGKENKMLLDPKEIPANSAVISYFQGQTTETEVMAFDGEINLTYGSAKKNSPVHINQYSGITGTSAAEIDAFNIVYIAPFEHLRGNIISTIIRNEAYKQICVKALQLFDPDIEDIMIFRSDVGNLPVEYIRHKVLGDMPVSSYGDGIKKVLVLSNAIAAAADGVLLIDEIETAIHKKYYDDILRFVVKACKSFNVQLFVTTHSIEAIDGLLSTQNYDMQEEKDDICVCTIKKTSHASLSRVLSGREVYNNREAFGFEVRI